MSEASQCLKLAVVCSWSVISLESHVAGDRRVVVAGDRLPRSKAASRCAISFIASAMILHRMLALGCLAVPDHAAAE